ncbi:MAG: ATP-binding cassette protein [Rhizobium sp.]|nr:ATP-binding cassette protein [Rhizobium sp.]
MALLEVKSVSKSFGALRAVDDISFSVGDGEIFGVAGPNGSGKSTLFNIITKIPFGPDSGQVVFAGREVQSYRANEIVGLGLVRTFQREASFDSLNVFENAWLPATYGRKDPATEDVVVEALSSVGFSADDLGRPARNLSVFDRKRLMLASAVACAPKMILLDEPASGLTKPEIEQTIGLVRDIAARGIAVLLIEHVLPFLMSLSQRLMVLNNGRIIGIGEPGTIMRDPAVVEAYLGTRRYDT